MRAEIIIYWVVFVLWMLVVIQGVAVIWGGFGFVRYIDRALANSKNDVDANGKFRYQPSAAIILPCCGVDERLHQTVERLGQQNYDDYAIIFTFESQQDPAYPAVLEWTRNWKAPRYQLVVAGLAQHRSQKIHNLLAAVDVAKRSDRPPDAYIFLDSDAVPHADWLGHLIAPLADPKVGAATGYRWYCAEGGLGNGVRCMWNAATVTLLHDEKTAFCWGGSTAILRETFERLDVARKWDRALSDDYQVTRAVRDANLAIRFVPQALIPSHDITKLVPFWKFARRQIIITRICGPTIWWAAFMLCLNFFIGGTAVALLFFAAIFGWIGDSHVAMLALVGWIVVLALASIKSWLRQIGIRRVLHAPDITWRDFAWDVLGAPLSGGLHMNLLLASLTSRKFVWRNTIYEMISPDETRVLGRIDDQRIDLRTASKVS